MRPGGDVAFANAALKLICERGLLDADFVARSTTGFDELAASLAATPLEDLSAAAGLEESQVEAFVDEYGTARSSILVWSMGITQHRGAVDAVRAIVNLALARGNVGREGAGLMPIRGHSGVQGGAEMGAYATALPGGDPVDDTHAAALGARWGFEVPAHEGLTAPEMVDAAARGDLDVLWTSGGNFLDVLPDPERVREALGRVPLRVHADVVLSTQMFVEGEDVILLPMATRYEQEGGGTETTTERRIVFSPELARRVGEARSEWRVYADVANRVRPDLRRCFSWPSNRDLRAEIASVVPSYAGIEDLATTGDQVQWGGRHLCAGGVFPTVDGRGRFSVVTAAPAPPPGTFTVATRRGKQFNSMVYAENDPMTGAGRDAVFMGAPDAERLGLGQGDAVRLRSAVGSFDGHVHLAPLPAGSLQVHWPEGNVLIPGGPEHREPGSHVPDYNAAVIVEAR